VLPYTAYLRVYEPLEAFPEPERSRWAACAEAAERPYRVATVENHSGGSPSAETRLEVWRRPPDHEGQNAYVRLFSGRAYLCPWKRRLRSWAAFSAVQGVPSTGATPTEDPHVWQSAWHVPFPWFVPFVREERLLDLGDRATGRPRALIYVTTMSRARQRLARATIAGERARTEVSPFGDAQSLQEDLSVFHPQSLVELDYGGLVHLMDDATLLADDSVGECAVALLALERGELELAVAMQLRLRSRWRAIRALQTAN
jgi:hypothetical protein